MGRNYARIAAFCLLLVTSALRAPAASAQGDPDPIALDIGIGAMSGKGGGDILTRSGYAATAQVMFLLKPLGRGGLHLGFSASSARVVHPSDGCTMRVSNLTSGCLPDYPTFNVVSAMAAYSINARAGTFRLLAGPAFAHANRKSSLGLSTRADLATPPLGQLSLTAWGEMAFVPSLGGASYTILSLGLGIRVH